MIIFPWISTGLRHLTPPFFFFAWFFFFFTICCADFYSFVLCSSLQVASCPICPCPLLHHWVQCMPTARDIFTMQKCWAATSPSYCFVLDYPFINQIISFLPPTLLTWVFACVSLSLRLEFLLSWSVSVQLHWLLHSPPSPRLATTLLADITLLWLFTSHTLPHINSVLGQHALYIVGRLFKKILLARILIEVTKHWLMQDEQFGFQPKPSTS